jgi:hypothetical protein
VGTGEFGIGLVIDFLALSALIDVVFGGLMAYLGGGEMAVGAQQDLHPRPGPAQVDDDPLQKGGRFPAGGPAPRAWDGRDQAPGAALIQV